MHQLYNPITDKTIISIASTSFLKYIKFVLIIQATHDTIQAARRLLKGRILMIIDVTVTELTPGNYRKNCLGNGAHKGTECCYDECDYTLCCASKDYPNICISCADADCPRRNPWKDKKSANKTSIDFLIWIIRTKYMSLFTVIK